MPPPPQAKDGEAGATRPSSSSLAALGRIVPERDAFRRDLLAILSGHIFSQPLASSSQIDGLVQAAPGCNPPLPLLAPSGLSRPQFLVAAQAASLPCFPAYAQSQVRPHNSSFPHCPRNTS